MNFPGRFDPSFSHGSPVSLDRDGFSFDSKPGFVQLHDGSDVVVIPDAHLLFSGNYMRIGNDLIISNSDHKFVVGNYFKGEGRPSLASHDGATLSGQIVDALTGHVHYAQANAPASGGEIIGHCLKLTGSASIVRNGVSVELHIGDAVQKGDVVQTGSDSSVGMTLVDGSAFGMTSNARMVLNEMIFDPSGSSNSSLISLVQGTITFVAGQTAKNGNMRVETPVATMGIRGTAVLVEISADNGPTKFSVLMEPDGHTGSYNLYDKSTGQLIGTVSQAGQVTFVSVGGIGQPPTAIEQLKTLQEQQDAKNLIQEVFKLYFPNYNPDDAKPNSNKSGNGSDVSPMNNFAGLQFTPPDLSRPTLTIPTLVTNPDTGKPTTVNVTFTNTAPIFQVTNATGVQATSSSNEPPHSFKLGDHVTIIDPDIGVAVFYDVAIPYVTNSGNILSTSGPSLVPSSYLLSQNLITLNHVTGLVTYNPEAFRFLGEGQTAVYKFTFTSSSGPDAAVQELILTIIGHNDAPVFALNDTPLSFSETAGQTGQSTAHLIVPIVLKFTDEDFSDIASSFTLSDAVTTNVTGAHPTADLTKLPDSGTLLSYLKIEADGVDTDLGVSRVSLSNAGQVNAKFSAPDNVFDFLAEGEQIQLVYTIEIKDAHGASSTQTVTITVTGTNDVPNVTADHTVHGLSETTDAHEIGGIPTLTTAGTLDFTDVDLNDTHTTTSPTSTVSVSWEKPDSSSAGTVPAATLTALATALTTCIVSDSANGATGHIGWTFKLPDTAADFLAQGETLTVVYDVGIDDGHGGLCSQPVTIVITGTNDGPHAVADINQGAAVVEAGNNPDDSIFAGNPSATGNVLTNDTDVDINDTHTVVGVGAGTATGPLSNGPGTIVGTYGSLVLNANGTWIYTLDNNNPLTNALAQDAHVNDVFSYTMSDNHGAISTATLTIAITGSNDSPHTNVAPAAVTDVNLGPAIVEAGVDAYDHPVAGVDHASGNVLTNDFDVDTGDTKTVQGVSVGSSSGPLSGQVGTVLAGTYGSVTIAADGSWTYTLDNGNPLTNALSANEHVSDIFTYTMRDTAGATSSATLTIDVTGTNDAPVITSSAPAAIGSVQEDVTLSVTGQLAASDVDHNATQSWSIHGSSAGTYGSIAVDADGQWTYTLDNGTDGVASAVQSLAAGEHHDELFTVRVTDDQGATADQIVTVTVTGTNDAPTIDAGATVATGAITKITNTTGSSATDSVSGSIAFADVDVADTHTSAVGSPTFTWSGGALTAAQIAALTAASSFVPNLSEGSNAGSVAWTYNITDSALDFMLPFQTLVAQYAVTITDAHGASIVEPVAVTVSATNHPLEELTAHNDAVTASAITPVVMSVLNNDEGNGIYIYDTLQSPYGNYTVSNHSAEGATLTILGSDIHRNAIIYDPTTSSLFSSLAYGQTATDYFSYKIVDDLGHVCGADVTVTLTGADHTSLTASADSLVNPHATVVSADATTLNPLDSLTGSGSDTLLLNGSGTFDLADVAHFSGFKDIAVHGNNASLAVDSTDTVGVDYIMGTGTNLTLTTSASVLDLSHTTVTGFSIEGSNPGGTTFVVGDSGTAAEIAAGSGPVTIQAAAGTGQSLTFTAPATGATLIGGAGNDTLISAFGNVTLTGGAGSDAFKFATTNFGADTITDFHAGQDTIYFDSSLFTSLAEILDSSHAQATGVGGADTLITSHDGNSTLLLKGVALGQLHQSDFHLV